MSKFILTAGVNVVDGCYEKLCDRVRHMSYNKEYWNSFIPPNRADFTFGPLTEEGVNNMKAMVNEIYADSPYSPVFVVIDE